MYKNIYLFIYLCRPVIKYKYSVICHNMKIIFSLLVTTRIVIFIEYNILKM